MKKSITKILTLVFALLLTVSVCACGGNDKPKDVEDMTDSELANALSSALGGNGETATNSEETESKEPEKEHKYATETLAFSYENEADESADSSEIGAGEAVTLNNYPVANYKGKIVHYFQNSIGSNLVVLSVDNGTLYVNSYLKDGSKKDWDNTVVSLNIDKTDCTKVDNITIVTHENITTVLVELDGKYYFDKLSSLNVKNPKLYLSELKGATKVLDVGTFNFSSNAIYVVNDNDASINLEFHTLNLPDGYTAKDVKEAYLEKMLVVVMNDGTVCTAKTSKNGDSFTFTVNEEITALYKDGHVKEFRFSSYSQGCTALVLLDDNKVYSFGEVSWGF